MKICIVVTEDIINLGKNKVLKSRQYKNGNKYFIVLNMSSQETVIEKFLGKSKLCGKPFVKLIEMNQIILNEWSSEDTYR